MGEAYLHIAMFSMGVDQREMYNYEDSCINMHCTAILTRF